MICQVCGKKEATAQIKTVLNGQVSERFLCADCAHKEGLDSWNPFQSFGGLESPLFQMSQLFGSFLGGAQPESVTRCPVCGCTFQDISRSGKVGCSDCYTLFYEQLLPSIQRIHGNTHHNGKNPTGNSLQVMPQSELAVADTHAPAPQDDELLQWKRELQQAIAAQEFEQAAVLRDKIKGREQAKGGGDA